MKGHAMSTEEAQKSPEEARPGISRRSITKGALWATPVVMLATAAPAAAYAPPCSCGDVTASATVTKSGAPPVYTLTVTLSNTCSETIAVNVLLGGVTVGAGVSALPGTTTVKISLGTVNPGGNFKVGIQALLNITPPCPVVSATVK